MSRKCSSDELEESRTFQHALSFEYAHNLYASSLILLSPGEVQKAVFGHVQAFYESYYLFIKDLRFYSYLNLTLIKLLILKNDY